MKDLLISEILSKYSTDKVSHHNYGETYDRLFSKFDRQAKLNILEIGTQKGGSLLAWKEYFPNAKVTGVDIVDVVEKRSPDISYVISDIKEWKSDEIYDIVIDDGSHFPEDILYVMENINYKLLIVEDIQDSRLWDGYNLVKCGEHYDDVLLIKENEITRE